IRQTRLYCLPRWYCHCPYLNLAGSLTNLTDASGRSITFTYGPRGHVIKAVDPAGRVILYSYGPRGNLDSVTEPDGGIWHFTYDPNHLLVAITSPDANTTLNTYDSSGRVISQTNPIGAVTTFTYSGDNFSSSGGTTTITFTDGTKTLEHYTDGALTGITEDAGTSQARTTTYQI
ncbi:YD repeat protein, partial [mine drainage metagenome]